MSDQQIDGPTDDGMGFHGTPLIISWLPVINAAVIIASLRWSKLSFFAHIILAGIVIGLSLGATIHVLQDQWLDVEEGQDLVRMHKIAGFIMVVWLGVEFITGLMARIIQFPKGVDPTLSYWMKRVHIVLSYMVMLIAKFNYFNIQFLDGQFNRKFIVLIIIDIVCLLVYLWIKFGYWTFSEEIVDVQLTKTLEDQNRNFLSKFMHSIWYSLLRVMMQSYRSQYSF